VFLRLRPIDWAFWRQILCTNESVITCFPILKVLKSCFPSKKRRFLDENTIRKFRKKFVIFLSVVSIYDVNFKILHWNHDKWKNNTEIAKIWNFGAKYPVILMWYEKSENVGLFCMSPTTTLTWSPFCEGNSLSVWHCVIRHDKMSRCPSSTYLFNYKHILSAIMTQLVAPGLEDEGLGGGGFLDESRTFGNLRDRGHRFFF